MDELLAVLRACFAQTTPLEPGRGFNGYSHTLKQSDEFGDEVWLVMYGGQNESINVCVKGDHASKWRDAALAHFPHHRITRVDTALDSAEPGFFDRMLPTVLDLGERAGVELKSEGVWFTNPTSRTQYAGSKGSERRFRMYEKGAEVRHRYKIKSADRNWVRCEMQFRPKRPVERLRIESCSQTDLWGLTAISRAVYGSILTETPVKRKILLPKKKTSSERAWENLSKQYGGTLSRMLDEWGAERFLEEVRALRTTYEKA